jgi:hypothetical protein
MEVKVSQKTLEILRDIITGDKKFSPYKSGPELVKFFNSLGFNDEYNRNFPSRRDYTETKLQELNKNGRIIDVINAYFNPINFIGKENLLNNLVDSINEYLEFDGYKIEIRNRKVRIITIVDEILEAKEINKLNNEIIRENIEKCDKRIEEGDFSGAITSARTFLESLLLFIYKEITKKDYEFNGDLQRLYKDVRPLIGLNLEKSTEEDIKKVLGGLISIVFGISGISNRVADRHGRLNEYKKEVLKPLSILIVNSVKTLSLYILNVYEKIKIQNDYALRNF